MPVDVDQASVELPKYECRMDERRYDIIPLSGSWLLTDSSGPAKSYLSLSEAMGAGRMAVDQWGGPVSIYLWDGDMPRLVHNRAASLDPGPH